MAPRHLTELMHNCEFYILNDWAWVPSRTLTSLILTHLCSQHLCSRKVAINTISVIHTYSCTVHKYLYTPGTIAPCNLSCARGSRSAARASLSTKALAQKNDVQISYIQKKMRFSTPRNEREPKKYKCFPIILTQGLFDITAYGEKQSKEKHASFGSQTIRLFRSVGIGTVIYLRRPLRGAEAMVLISRHVSSEATFRFSVWK